jgi:hypothetical protein
VGVRAQGEVIAEAVERRRSAARRAEPPVDRTLEERADDEPLDIELAEEDRPPLATARRRRAREREKERAGGRGHDDRGGRRTDRPSGLDPTRPRQSARELLSVTRDYIPVEIATAYIPIVGALVEGDASKATKFWVAVVIALLGAAAVAAAGRSAATQAALEQGEEPPSLRETVEVGWFEIAVAPLAFFAWAAAIPANFADLSWLGGDAGPIILVSVVALSIGIFARLLNRPTTVQ